MKHKENAKINKAENSVNFQFGALSVSTFGQNIYHVL